jgi:glycosyltransferase involved in cell wall biosynthesis
MVIVMKKQLFTKKSIKYLFISHVSLSSSYGAGQSAQLLISVLSKINNNNIHVIEIQTIKNFLKSIFRDKKNYKKEVMPLPWINNFDGSLDHKYSIWEKTKLIIQNKFSMINAKVKLRYIVSDLEFKIIHINSLVLIPILSLLDKRPDVKKICHVREVCIDEKITRKLLHKVDLFICIDKTTRDRIEQIYNIPADKLKIIPNPVSEAPSVIRTKLKPVGQPLNVGLVGQIFPHKGHEFVLNCFNMLPENEFNLIIVGEIASNAYASSLVQKTYASKNIFWIGHVNNFYNKGGYEQFDVLLRADPDHRVGRTMYEGLISGNVLVTPLSKYEKITDPLLMKFRKNIVTYEPNNNVDLIENLNLIKNSEFHTNNDEIKLMIDSHNEHNKLAYKKLIESFF